MSATIANGWADRIRPHLAGAVDNIIAAGRELLDAKAALPHGEFGPLLDELGLSRQMAGRFMRVAANPVLSNRSPVGGLPAAVSVLDVLAQLDDDVLAEAIETGRVTAGTTREQARTLVAAADPPSPPQARAHQLELAQMWFDGCSSLPRDRHGEITDSAALDHLADKLDDLRIIRGVTVEQILEAMWVILWGFALHRTPDPQRPLDEQFPELAGVRS